MSTPDGRIAKALELAQVGITDGAHHKMWVIDQMVRALLDCPFTITHTNLEGETFIWRTYGENDTYRAWVAAFEAGDDGPNTYEWDTGIAP